MHQSASYVYFAFKGDFNPDEITECIEIAPTASWRKGEIGKLAKNVYKFSLWELSTTVGKEDLDMNTLVKEIVNKLKGKEKIIVELKSKLKAHSILQIKMDIDVNEENATPYIGHDLETITFLYKTQTEADIDIYRYNSKKD